MRTSHRILIILSLTLHLILAEPTEDSTEELPKTVEKAKARQMEYVSLINTILQQTQLLSSVDGVLVALTTVVASLITKFKPFLVATFFSYFIYVATAILLPLPLAKMGLPTMDTLTSNKKSGRSVGGGNLLEDLLGAAGGRIITISPVKNIVTNVSVNVITDTMARIRMLSQFAVQQLSLIQTNMLSFSRTISNECISRFLCRVGQFTEVNFPFVSTFLRTVSDSFPNMDDYAIAIVRGTSSSNCSLIYPDCTA